MAVQISRVFLIEIDKHGQLLSLFIVIGNGQCTLKPYTVFICIIEQYAVSPFVFFLPWICVCNSLGSLKGHVTDIIIWIICKTFDRIHHSVRFLRL